MEKQDIGIENEWVPQNYEKEARMGFIRKVYGILLMQLAITTLITGIAVASEGFRDWMQANVGFLIACMIINFIVMIVLFCFNKPARKVPTNYILTFIFTLTESFLVANFAAFYDPVTVIIAASMTLGVTVGVTAYACTTKRDYTTCGGSLFGLVIGGILFAIFIGIFYHSRPLQVVVCLIFVVIYTFYIVYDTQLIAGGGKWKLGYDDYMIGALCLYVDIIGLFIYILSLLGNKR
jgi:protein lifeguard